MVFTLADTAFAFACNSYNESTVAAAASIDFLAASYEGDELTAVATELWRTRRNGIYEITVTNQKGARIALFRGRSSSDRWARGEHRLRTLIEDLGMQLQSFVSGKWQAGTRNFVTLRDATTNEVIASASAEGVDYRAMLWNATQCRRTESA